MLIQCLGLAHLPSPRKRRFLSPSTVPNKARPPGVRTELHICNPFRANVRVSSPPPRSRKPALAPSRSRLARPPTCRAPRLCAAEPRLEGQGPGEAHHGEGRALQAEGEEMGRRGSDHVCRLRRAFRIATTSVLHKLSKLGRPPLVLCPSPSLILRPQGAPGRVRPSALSPMARS